MLTGAGRTASWTSFNMPATIALGGAELRWLYGPERQRMRETLTNTAHTLQVDGFAGARFERRQQVSNNAITATSLLVFGGEMVAIATEASASPGVVTTVWQLKDHLGSTTTLLNTSGQLSGARKGYDVWGKRRFVTGADDDTNSITSASNRDFTVWRMSCSLGMAGGARQNAAASRKQGFGSGRDELPSSHAIRREDDIIAAMSTRQPLRKA